MNNNTTTKSQITEYHEMEIRVTELLDRLKDFKINLTTNKGLEEAKKVRAELRCCRVDMEKLRTETKAPVLIKGSLIDSEAKRIIFKVTAEETAIDEKIKEEESRKEKEKAEKIRLEKIRVDGIQARITALRNIPLSMMGKTTDELSKELQKIEYLDMTKGFDEFINEAAIVHTYVVQKIQEMLQIKKIEEEQLEKIYAERQELERQRAEQLAREAQAAEAERLAKAEIAAQEKKLNEEKIAQEVAFKAQQKALDEQRIALAQSVQKPVEVPANVIVMKQAIAQAASVQVDQHNSLLSEACTDLAMVIEKYSDLAELGQVVEASRAFLDSHAESYAMTSRFFKNIESNKSALNS